VRRQRRCHRQDTGCAEQAQPRPTPARYSDLHDKRHFTVPSAPMRNHAVTIALHAECQMKQDCQNLDMAGIMVNE
jgi:hypothetical protein